MLTTLTELLSIQSVAGNGTAQYPYGAGPAAALDHVLALCRSMGFRTKNAAYRYGYAEIGDGPEIIGILAHLDTVPAGSGWHYPPFAATLADGRLYGRGAQDDKGPVVACIYAMKDLLDSGIPLRARIRLILGQDEETGDWADMKEYCRCEQPPTLGFTPDGAFPAIYAEKGVLLLCLSAPLEGSGFRLLHGGAAPNMVADSCHAQLRDGQQLTETGVTSHGSLPWEGQNAITALLKGLAARPAPPPYAVSYMRMVGEGFHGEGLGCGEMADAISGRISVNAGLVETAEDRIRLYLDIRYPVTYRKEQVLARVSAAAAVWGQTVTCRYESPPLHIEKESPLMQALLGAYRDVTGDMQGPIAIGGGSYARAMRNIAAFGPGFPGGANTEHGPDEYIRVQELQMLREIYGNALRRLLKEV